MKKLFLVLLFNSLTALVLHGSSAVHYTDIALSGSGKPIANAPVRVCNEPVTQTGPCLPLATVYSDVGLSVVKTNPFTADVLGNIDFYYDSSSGKHIAVEVSCQAGIPGCGPQGTTLTQRNICVFCGETMQVNDLFVATQPIFDFVEGVGIQLSGSDDPTNNRAKLLINSLGIPHVLLGPQHTDTVLFSPPDIGDLIRGNLNQFWEHQPVAQIGEVYTLIDVGGGQPIGEWVFPNTLDTCTSVQVDGVESGCEHEINFHGNNNITITATDDSDNDRTNVTISGCASCGGAGTTNYDLIFSLLPACPLSNTCGTDWIVSNESPLVDDSFSTQTCNQMDGTGDLTMPICYIRYGGGAGLDNGAVLYGPNEHYFTKVTHFSEKYERISATTNVRWWTGLTSSGSVSFLNTDDPTVNALIAFRYSSGTGAGPDPGAGDTHWMCAYKTAAAAITLIDSGVAPNTNPHKFKVAYNLLTTTLSWSIDDVEVCTANQAYVAVEPMEWFNTISNLDAAERTFDFGYHKGGVVVPLGP